MLQPTKNMNYTIKIVSDSNKENIAPYFISRDMKQKKERNPNDPQILSDITSRFLKKPKQSGFDKIVKLY